jgi:NAD(P)-dependent dehydrogenase (short-subunit alcohol dehydrogenase family)
MMDGRVAVVTGSSRGIGATIARRFAAEGAAVAVVARTESPTASRLPGTVHEVVDEIRGAGGTAVAVPADLSQPPYYDQMVARVEEDLGPIDILVNNAGINHYAPLGDVTEKRYRLMFEIMVHAPFRLCQLVVPGMAGRRHGWILNITSKQARHPVGPPYPDWACDGCLVYGMCKAALDRLTTGLAAEVQPSGVNVNSLGTSGLVLTPGAVAVSPHTAENAFVEPDTAMPDAAVALCTGSPGVLTGRITYSLEFFGRPVPVGAWAPSLTF